MGMNFEGYTRLSNGGGFRSSYSASKSVAWSRTKNAYCLVFSRFVPQEIRDSEYVEVHYSKEKNTFLIAPSSHGDFRLASVTSRTTRHLNSKSLATFMAKVFGIRSTGTKPTIVHLSTGITGSDGKHYLLIKGVYDVESDPFAK